MNDSTATYQRLFAELKRRNVFRVMAVYGIVGFVVLQVVDLLIPALLLPEWTYRLVAVLLLVGFPVAVVLAWAFEQTPTGLKRTAPADPSEIHAIVAAPAHRRWPAGLLALLGVALLLGGWWVGRRGASSAVAEAEASPALRLAMAAEARDSLPTIAVLPFLDLSPQGDQEYFSDGMSEELLNSLAKINELRVVGRTSSFAFKGKDKDLRVIGDELGAKYILEGSVRKAGDRLRITAQLIDADQNVHLWSNTYDRDLNDVFAIQTEIAEAVAQELRVPLGLDGGNQLVSPTADLEGYDLYLAGRARMRERGEGVQEAVKMFEAAIARDSAWAPAWAGLAESRSLVPFYTNQTRDSTFWANSLGAAERAAQRALELDPQNSSALVALGNVHRDRHEWPAAEDAYVRALTLDPENVEGLQQYAEYLSYIGRMDEAYRLAQRALALDRSPIRLNIAGLMARLNGRYAEASRLLDEGIRADPDIHVGALRNNEITMAADVGDWATYRRLLDELLILRDDKRTPESRRVEIREARTRLQELWPPGSPLTAGIAEWMTDNVRHITGAEMYLALGDRERALKALEFYVDRPERAYGETRQYFNIALDPLRDDPRFEAVLAANDLAGRRPMRLPPDGREAVSTSIPGLQ